MNRRITHALTATLLGGAMLTGCSMDESMNDLDIGSSVAPLLKADPDRAIPNEYIVVFRDEATILGMNQAVSRVEARNDESRIEFTYSVIPGFAGTLSPAALDELRRDPSVLYIEENSIVTLNAVHNAEATGIDRIDQRTLPLDGLFNDYGNLGAGVHAIIVDTGVRSTHQDFGGRVGIGYTAINDGRGPEDCNGHGTHVASTMAGGTYGVARNAFIHSARVLSCNGSGTMAGVVGGVDWTRTTCVGNGWDCVANMSLGGGANTTLDNAVANAVAAGITFAVAAGNDNANACNYSPARVASAITVGSTVPNTDARSSFSNHGNCVDIFAPGSNIKAAWYTSDTATNTISGTSMASPHVAGVATVYLGANPGSTPAQVLQGLLDSGTYNCLSNVGSGSPNVLVHNDFSSGSYSCGGGGDPDPPPPDDDFSCQGRCDGAAPGGCFCDFWCIFFGDCCPDYIGVCL